jgi:hypothetical protein
VAVAAALARAPPGQRAARAWQAKASTVVRALARAQSPAKLAAEAGVGHQVSPALRLNAAALRRGIDRSRRSRAWGGGCLKACDAARS